MAMVTSEILTIVKMEKAAKQRGYKIRAYNVTAQLVVTDMTELNFHQLNLQPNGSSAIVSIKLHIPVRQMLAESTLKTRINKQMARHKKRIVALLKPPLDNSITLTSGGQYKDVLTI